MYCFTLFGIIAVLLAGVPSIAVYAFIKIKLSAEYLTPLYYTNWITDFFDKGIVEGFHNLIYRIYAMCLNIADYMKSGIISGLCAGAIFAAKRPKTKISSSSKGILSL